MRSPCFVRQDKYIETSRGTKAVPAERVGPLVYEGLKVSCGVFRADCVKTTYYL
jgi:hypothetical protein